MRIDHQLTLLAVIPAVALACSILDPTFSVPARIIFSGDTARIAAPDLAARGASFEVSVPTFGGGCTRRIARTDVRLRGLVAQIRPYNETRRSDTCTADILFLTHVVSVHFDQLGEATIRVFGEQGTGARREPAQIERRVVIH